MKKILTIAPIVPLTFALNHFYKNDLENKIIIEQQKSDDLLNYMNDIVKIMSKNIDNENENEIKEIILDSIYVIDGIIRLNFTKILTINNDNIRNILNDDKFERVLQQIYDSGSLLKLFDKFVFIDKFVNLRTRGLWIETHWYWFGYVQPHLDSKLVDDWTEMVRISDGITIFVNMIDLIPEFTTVAPTLGPFIILAGVNFFKSYDKGNGMGFGSYAMIGFVAGSFFSD